MTLKEIASSFELGVNDFAKMIGYTRQAMHYIMAKRNGVNESRFNSALDYLEVLSKDMYQRDMDEANLQRHIRQRAIEELRKYGSTGKDGR